MFWKANKRVQDADKVTHCFKDNEQAQFYLKNGYLKLEQIIPLELISTLSFFIDSLKNNLDEGFKYSTMMFSPEMNQSIHLKTTEALQLVFDQLFENYTPYSSTYLIKPAYTSEMDLHQDWSFTDERLFLPVTFWVPLHDIDIEDGSIYFIPGSQSYFKNIRSSSLETARLKRADFGEDDIQKLKFKAGDLLLFNPSVFHGSFANHTDRHRLVYSVTILPDTAPLFYYHKKNNKEVNILSLSQDAFLTQMQDFNKTNKFTGDVYKTIKYSHEIPTVNHVIKRSKMSPK